VRTRLAVALAFGALLLPTVLRAQAPDSPERFARQWLWLLDEARYDSAWSVVVPAMQAVVTYPEWTTSLQRLRAGARLPRQFRRTLRRAEPSVPLFGGSSVILSFDVVPGALREIVVLVRTGGRWQVGGYGILRD
jgi:hypothetical protein